MATQPQGGNAAAVQILLNLKDYMEGRADGSVVVVKLRGKPHYSERAFDQKSGAPVPKLVPLDQSEIEGALAAEKANAEEMAKMAAFRVAALEQLLKDMATAEEKLPL